MARASSVMPGLFRHPRFGQSRGGRFVLLGGPRHKAGVTGMVCAALLIATPALADTPLPPAAMADTQLPDPHQEAEARALMETLRCVVCQGQSIAQSDADMAGQMRALVRQRIAAGETPGEIRTWLIARYGDYITYDPPLNWLTAPLWLMPLVLLVAGAWIARASFKRRKRGRG